MNWVRRVPRGVAWPGGAGSVRQGGVGQLKGVCRASPPVIAALALMLGAHGARAVDPSDYLLLPSVVEGEREIDWHSGVGSAGARTRHRDSSGIGFGTGVTQNWFTEVAAEYRRDPRTGTTLNAYEWENIVLLAEPGEWLVDVGMLLNVEQPHRAAEGPSIRLGPLLQKEFGRFQANFNLIYSRHYRSTEMLPAHLSYQGQFKYRYSRPFEFGIQAFGNVGSVTQSWAPYSEQVHRFGPAVLGRFVVPGEQSLSYNAAFLVGSTARSPDRTFRVQLEYEF